MSQATTRQDYVALELKAGTAAPVNTAIAPAADAGWTALYTITVNAGQTSIVASNIAVVTGAPFLQSKLNWSAVGGCGSTAFGGGGGATGPTGACSASLSLAPPGLPALPALRGLREPRRVSSAPPDRLALEGGLQGRPERPVRQARQGQQERLLLGPTGPQGPAGSGESGGFLRVVSNVSLPLTLCSLLTMVTILSTHRMQLMATISCRSIRPSMMASPSGSSMTQLASRSPSPLLIPHRSWLIRHSSIPIHTS